jgi:hypothetical protein
MEDHMPKGYAFGPAPALAQTFGTSADDELLGSNVFTGNSLLPTATWPTASDARCSRCRETTDELPRFVPVIMLKYGLNLCYCSRCADFVGWKPP